MTDGPHDEWALTQMRKARTKQAPEPVARKAPVEPVAQKAVPPVASPAPTPKMIAVSPGAFTSRAMVGILLLVIGIAGLVSYATMPYASLAQAGPSFDREQWLEINRGFDYVADAVEGPFTWYIFLIVSGVLLIASDLLPLPRVTRSAAQGSLLIGGGLFAYLIVLDTARMFGVYFVHFLNEGAAEYHLHVGPYLDAAFGLAAIAVALFPLHGIAASLTGPLRSRSYLLPLSVVIALSVGFVLIALVPLGMYRFDLLGSGAEVGISLGMLEGAQIGDLHEVGDDWVLAEGMLWAVFWLALPAAVALRLIGLGPYPGIWRGVGQLMTIAGIPFFIGTIFLVLTYVALWTSENVSGIVNYLPFVVYAVAIIAYGLFLVREAVPFLRTVHIAENSPQRI